MKIKIVIDLDDYARRALRARVSADGKPATREECQRMLFNLLLSDLEVIVSDYDSQRETELGQ